MRVLRREFFDVTRASTFTIVPFGDCHIGSAACDESLLRGVVKRILDTPDCFWIGMGDFAEWINVRDKRFDPGGLADWVETSDLVDLAGRQQEYFLDMVRPIAHKCLALVEGNHERTIKEHTERDVFSNIVTAIKAESALKDELKNRTKIGVGSYGWLQLAFYRSPRRTRSRVELININLHHGFAGGKLAGGKALNMQRWLWTRNADIVVWGHSHNVAIQPEAVEEIDQGGNVTVKNRRGVFAGTFLRTINEDGPSTYSEIKGYFPLPTGGVVITICPHAHNKNEQIRMTYEG